MTGSTPLATTTGKPAIGDLETVVTTDVAIASDALVRGELVAFPTETVYGLGADASRSEAVRRVFTAKGRPTGHPLIVHLGSVDAVWDWIDLDAVHGLAQVVAQLAEAFWPGPLTMVVPRSSLAAVDTVGGMDTVGLRVPAHPVALALLEACGLGVAAPSANPFGSVSPTTAGHVLSDLDGRVEVILDGGPTAVGVESTIIDLSRPRPVLLRPGGVSRERLEAVLGRPVPDPAPGEKYLAPGRLKSHYSPNAQVVVLADSKAFSKYRAQFDHDPTVTVGLISPTPGDYEPSWFLPADPALFATGLYDALRSADAALLDRVVVVPPNDGPLLEAVLDRLAKASANSE